MCLTQVWGALCEEEELFTAGGMLTANRVFEMQLLWARCKRYSRRCDVLIKAGGFDLFLYPRTVLIYAGRPASFEEGLAVS